MKTDAETRDNPFKIRRLLVAAAAGIALAPVCAHAQSAPPMATPGAGYYSDRPFVSWLDMVSASQAAQPRWMTPLVTVTPRLEQEFRWDFYSQQQGTGSQGNGPSTSTITADLAGPGLS
jgi:hypothetical protein